MKGALRFFSMNTVRTNPEILPVLFVLGSGMTFAVTMTARQSMFNPDVALFDKSKSINVPEGDFLFGGFKSFRDYLFPGVKTYQSENKSVVAPTQ